MLRSLPLLSPSSIYRNTTTRLIGCTCSHYSTSSSRHQHPPSPILSHTTHDDTQLKQVFDSPSFLSQSPSSQRTGIFHQPSLTTPSSLPALALRTTLRAQLIVNRICTPSTPPSSIQEAEVAFLGMVKNLDRLSDLLCGVIDLSELVRNVHPVQEWGEKANEAYEMLCEFMNGLNTNVGLYEALKSLHSLLPTSTPAKSPQLFSAYAVAIPFLRDFEKSGIHLPSSERQKFVNLSTSILQLGRKFLQNASEPMEEIDLSGDYEEIKKGMGEGFTRRLFEHGAYVDPTSWEARTLARQHSSASIRRKLHVASCTSLVSHVETLEELLRTRGELARLVGRESWGEVALEDKMAKSPRNVMSFLDSLNKHNLPLAGKDLKVLQALKAQHLGGLGGFKKPMIEAWDRDFYSDQSLSSTSPLPDISPFFSLGTCFLGLSRLFTSLYGIRFEVAPIEEGEVWDRQVRKLRVVDEEEGVIGIMYCDLFAREGKGSGAAHYTVRCSRRVDDDDAEADFLASSTSSSSFSESTLITNGAEVEIGGVGIGREELEGLEVKGVEWKGREGVHQTPIIVLVCGLGEEVVEGGRKGPTFLQWHEVETLFHEMGHAIHSMIGRTDYHNVSGTRCATDFVELPSILMEHFVSDPTVLSTFTSHHRTGRPLPKDILTSMLDARKRFSALEISTQISMAALDQAYHSTLSPEFSSTETLKQINEEYHVIPSAEGSTWQTQFGHLFGYGATYYSYLFDRAIAAKIYKEKFSKDPLSREKGEDFKKGVLRWGGGKDPWECVGGLVGGDEVSRGGEAAMRVVGRWGIEASENER